MFDQFMIENRCKGLAPFADLPQYLYMYVNKIEMV